jgi:hypothetical protein
MIDNLELEILQSEIGIPDSKQLIIASPTEMPSGSYQRNRDVCKKPKKPRQLG